MNILVERQLKPEFPADIIQDLKDHDIIPTSMIDVSDGLASDLLHICKMSGTGSRIFYDRIPVDTETARAAEEFKMDPVTAALNGGEDYELLFTAPLENLQKIKGIRVKLIGHLTTPDQGNFIVSGDGSEIELKAQGWEKGDE
jgi:thiamine-monophosphate kinase